MGLTVSQIRAALSWEIPPHKRRYEPEFPVLSWKSTVGGRRNSTLPKRSEGSALWYFPLMAILEMLLTSLPVAKNFQCLVKHAKWCPAGHAKPQREYVLPTKPAPEPPPPTAVRELDPELPSRGVLRGRRQSGLCLVFNPASESGVLEWCAVFRCTHKGTPDYASAV